MRTDEESVILAQRENRMRSGGLWYEPESLNCRARDFVETVVKNDSVDWAAFSRMANEPRGLWSFTEARDAFFSKLLDLGLLTFNQDWNYLVMTGDEFGSNPFFGYGHLYFTRQTDALAYATALYEKRGRRVSIFRLQPT